MGGLFYNSVMNNFMSFEHHFLIAMPSLDDSWFARTVIYIIEDNEKGTSGLVLNKPHKLTVKQLLEHFHIDAVEDREDLQASVYMGGPVDMERGFILHQPLGAWQNSMRLPENMGLTVSEDFLQAIANQTAPKNYITCLGLANWTKGQLMNEIMRNSWLTAPFNSSLVFDTPCEQRWKAALGMLGVRPETLSHEVGHG
jgi:putative transcriptional regulator